MAASAVDPIAKEALIAVQGASSVPVTLFAERDFKTRNQKQRTGWGLVQRSRALSEGEAETPMGAPPMNIPHFAIQSARHLKFKTYLLTVC